MVTFPGYTLSRDYTVQEQNIRLQYTLHRRHNERDGVSNHQRLDCLLSRLFRRR